MKYRIKEYTDKYGTRVYQIQEKKWWGWKNASRWYPTHNYTLHEATCRMKWMIASDELEAKNKAKPAEYHYK
jgi:hypothetical protein